jgi:hypothetical protein
MALYIVGAATQQQLRHVDAGRRISKIDVTHRPLALHMAGIGERAAALDVREEGLKRRARDAERGAAERDGEDRRRRAAIEPTVVALEPFTGRSHDEPHGQKPVLGHEQILHRDRQLGDDIEMGMDIELVPAEALGLPNSEEAGATQIGDRATPRVSAPSRSSPSPPSGRLGQ